MSKLSLSVERSTARPSGSQLALLAQADRAISEAITVADAVRLVAGARALDEWAKAVRAGEEHERKAAVFVLRAKRNAGQRIAEAQARGEVAVRGQSEPFQSHVAAPDMRTPATLADVGVTRDQSSEWKRLAAEWSDEALTAAAEEMERPSLAGIQARSPGMFTSDTPEWYTPRHIVDAVVAVLGTIDLDPCAEPAKSIPAAAHFTADDNGLEQGWRGRIYMNPPYGREIVAWIEKLAREYLDGHVSEAVALVPARTDTAWFRALPDGLACFFSGRLAFSNSEVSAPFPSVAWYIGPNGAAFVAAFAGHGDIYQRIERAA